MGAVRIYKEDIGDGFPWQARVGGCSNRDSSSCHSGHYQHLEGKYCNAYSEFGAVIESLNSSGHYDDDIGAYIKK